MINLNAVEFAASYLKANLFFSVKQITIKGKINKLNLINKYKYQITWGEIGKYLILLLSYNITIRFEKREMHLCSFRIFDL